MINNHPVDIAYQEPDIDVRSIIQATFALLNEQPDITAIVSVHGEYVIGIIEAIKQLGKSVPEDMSVVVIGNKQQSEKVFPALTRVDLPSEHLEYLATKMLIEKLETQPIETSQILVQPELVDCGSTRSLF